MIRFANVLRKYEVPFYLIRKTDGTWNEDGKYVQPAESRESHKGSVQPLSIRLLQAEAGRYSSDDRVIYTTTSGLQVGDVIEHQGERYTIDTKDDRAEYNDVFKYIVKRVSIHDNVPSD